MVSLSGTASGRGYTWAESWNISMWLSTMAAKHFRWRNSKSSSFLSGGFMVPEALGSTISPLFSGLLCSPGHSSLSLAAAALLVLVPVRELTWEALLLLLLPGPENSWSCLSSLGEDGGAEHACASIPGSVGRVYVGGGGCSSGWRAKCWSAGVATENRSGYSENEVTAQDLMDKPKDSSEKGEVEITSTKTEWNREGSCIRRGRMPMSCWRATNVAKQK